MAAPPRERTPADVVEVIYAISPSVFERARRIKCAMDLLRAGLPRREVSGAIQRRYGVSQQVAWAVVDVAVDMAGPLE